MRQPQHLTEIRDPITTTDELTGVTETRTPGRCITRVERKEDNYDYISEEDTPNEPRYNTSSYQLNTYKNETRKKILRELEKWCASQRYPRITK